MCIHIYIPIYIYVCIYVYLHVDIFTIIIELYNHVITYLLSRPNYTLIELWDWRIK